MNSPTRCIVCGEAMTQRMICVDCHSLLLNLLYRPSIDARNELAKRMGRRDREV